MIRTHPLFQPVMGLAPFLALEWEVGPENNTIWPETGKPLQHATAILTPTPLKCDAITDGESLFSVGYGIGKLFEDDCFEPTSLDALKKEATQIHLHQLCTFIATDIDPLPFADPMIVTAPRALDQYVAGILRQPCALTSASKAIHKLLEHLAS